MKVMKYTFLLIFSVLLLTGGVIGFGLGIYTKDSSFMAIGALLVVASILTYIESKKARHDPFL